MAASFDNQRLERLREAVRRIQAAKPKKEGKWPGSSPLHGYVGEIAQLREDKASLRAIAEALFTEFGVQTSKSSLSAFLKRQSKRAAGAASDQIATVQAGASAQKGSSVKKLDFVSNQRMGEMQAAERRLKNQVEVFVSKKETVVWETFKSDYGRYPDEMKDDLAFWKNYFENR